MRPRIPPASWCRPRPRSSAGRCEQGSAVLYAVVLSPLLLLALTLGVEVGALQLERQRLHSAVDEAVITATGAASGGEAAHLDPQLAVARVRRALADNLAPLRADLAGATPESIAADAEVVVVTAVPAPDPFDPTRTVERPTVEIRAHVPVRAGLLTLAHLHPTVTLVLVGAADIRVVGGAQP